MSLIEKIRAKEREKKAREMYQNKDEEIRMKRLKRLPDIARYVKGVFVSEQKKAREMYQNKDEEIRMKRLKRLPDIARYVKGIFVSEQRNALKQPFLLQKLFQSYPGWMDKDT